MQFQAAAHPCRNAGAAIERRMQVAPVGVDLEQFSLRQIVTPDGVRRQHRIEFRHRAQHMGNEGVGVRPWPDPVAAGRGIGVGRDRRFDLRD
ncbi:hypothetical protein D3C87_1697600 [compost metagenome]